MDDAKSEAVGAPIDTPADLPAPALRCSQSPHGSVRPLERSDLERVASLFISTFRQNRRKPSQKAVEAVAAYMDQLYLQGPFSQSGMNSLVQVDRHGDIGAFLGLLKSRYSFNGEVLTACIAGTLMAAEGVEHGRAAPQLLRALNNADFDLLLTDSANRTSLVLAQPMKYELLTVNSLQWLHAFKPAAMLAYKLRRKWPRTPMSLLRPFVHAGDVLAKRILKAAPRRAQARWQSETIDAATFATIAPTFLPAFRLHPLWSAHEIHWLVGQAAAKRSNGPLNFALVRDSSGALAGCYAFYGEAGRVAHVLQILALESRWGVVVDCLIAAAEEMGCIGVIGQAQEAIMPHLYTYPGLLFYYAGGTMVRSRHREVIQSIRTKDIFVGGLVGDQWTRLSADEFGIS